MEVADWRNNLIDDRDSIRGILQRVRRIAVLGIKPRSRPTKAAHYVPAFLQEAGYDIVPVPTYYPDVEEILGEPVFRRLVDIPGEVDLVNVFRRPRDIPPHLDDLLARAPQVVWFQLGIRHDEAAERLARAGIQVVQDRCIMIDHRHLGVGTS